MLGRLLIRRRRSDQDRLFSTFAPKSSKDHGLPSSQSLLDKYRLHGYLHAQLDPLCLRNPTPPLPMASPQLDEPVMLVGQWQPDGHYLEAQLQRIYCQHVGYEFAHLQRAEEREWLVQLIERMALVQPSTQTRLRWLNLLIGSEAFDHFMGKRYGQVKRYGLEGAESMMVAMDALVQGLSRGSEEGCLVVGMPHRGRLNLLTGLMGLPPAAIFHKLRGLNELGSEAYAGDVLSHLAHAGPLSPRLHGILLPNPSHLEAINPVAMGVARKLKGLCLQIHGDAAFAGQGVVAETLQLSGLPGYQTGGSLHLIVNNQVGYTTQPHLGGRTSLHASDQMKMIDAPIIHVNGDHPEVCQG